MNKTIITIPTYNSLAFIAKTIHSVQEQTYKDFDLYVIDDCSKDGTTDVIHDFEKQDDRIHLICNELNVGLSKNFNRCVELAFQKDADFFLLICHDDIIYPEYLQEKLAVMNTEPSVVMVCNTTDIINKNGKKISVRKTLPIGMIDGRLCVQKSLYRGNIFGEPSGVLLRVEAMRKAGQFDERFFYSLDWEYFSRIALQGNVACIDHPLNAFRVSDSSSSSRILKNMKELKEEHTLVVKSLCSHLNVSLTWPKMLLSNLLFICKSWVKRIVFIIGG